VEKKTSHLFGLNLLPCKVCLPVNSEVADKRERKYARVERNLGSLDLEPEPTVRLLTGRGLLIELRICCKLELSSWTESLQLGWTCHLV